MRRIEVVDERVAEILREEASDEKLRLAFSLWEMARTIIEANLRKQHPELTEREILIEVARRMSGASASG